MKKKFNHYKKAELSSIVKMIAIVILCVVFFIIIGLIFKEQLSKLLVSEFTKP